MDNKIKIVDFDRYRGSDGYSVYETYWGSYTIENKTGNLVAIFLKPNGIEIPVNPNMIITERGIEFEVI